MTVRGKVLLTGATGFVGRALLPALLARGYEVVCPVRPRHLAEPRESLADATLVPLSHLGPDTDWTQGLDGVQAVIHLAGMAHVRTCSPYDRYSEFLSANTGAALSLGIQAARAGAERFVFISSVGVNGTRNRMGHPFRDTDPPNPQNAYAATKLAAEQGLRKIENYSGMSVVVVRPPLVYGPGLKANFLRLIRLVDAGLPLPFAGVCNRKSFIGLANLVDVLITCLEHSGAPGRTFLVSDEETVGTEVLIRKIAGALERPARLFPFPERLAGAFLQRTGRRRLYDQLWADLCVDDAGIRKALGWKPTRSMDKELKAAARWYLAKKG